MSFRRLEKVDIPQLLLWFDDPEIQRHLGGFDPPQKQFDMILEQVHRSAYVWDKAGEILAFAEIEWEENWVNLLITVKRSSRKQGLGKKLLFHLQSLKLAPYYHAYIDPNNKASIQCFKGAGFRFMEEEEAMEKWVWQA